jgi:hypothetical protein
MKTGLEQFDLNMKNYNDISPFILEKTGLKTEFTQEDVKNFRSLEDFVKFVLIESEITDIIPSYANYFFKMTYSKKFLAYVDELFKDMPESEIEKFSHKIDFLQSILNRGFSYSSQRLTYFHSIGLKYDRFEFEKMLLPVIMEGKVSQFLFLAILYRIIEILSESMEKINYAEKGDLLIKDLSEKLKAGELEYTLEEINIFGIVQLSKIFDRFLRLTIRQTPKGDGELKKIKTVDDVFRWVVAIFKSELKGQ